MKLLKTNVEELVRKVEGGQLFTSNFRYKVSDAEGEMDYKGPKIPHQVWMEVLSFFKWTYDTHHSESQVRLYVSPKLGLWKAWAFPQKGGTGLSTKEVQNEESKRQRASLFENEDDWIAWGTIHHHCGISAFQSGTDERDEEGQGGLHITIGDMDKPVFSMHARLYHQGDLYEPQMEKFWHTTHLEELEQKVPEQFRAMLPKDHWQQLVVNDMCTLEVVPFPDIWKSNYIIEKREPLRQIGGTHADWKYDSETNTFIYPEKKNGSSQEPPEWKRCDDALTELEELSALYNLVEGDLAESLAVLAESWDVIEILVKNKVDAADVLDHLRRKQANEMYGHLD